MANRANTIQLALDLRRGFWLIDAPEAFLPVVDAFLSRSTAGPVLEDYRAESYRLTDDGDIDMAKDEDAAVQKVIVVPVHGPMTKYDTCESYGTTTIAQRMLRYMSEDGVVGFVLDIDSGGGSANAVPPLVEAISKARAAGLPVIVHADACFSAAYWVASQCDAVFLDNPLSSCGSIGAYAQLLDNSTDGEGRKIITIYAPESKDKNIAYRDALAGKPEKMEKELSSLVAEFRSAVQSGRPGVKDMEGVFSGAKFAPAEAVAAGLADGQASLDDCIANIFIRHEFNNQQ